MITVVIPAYNAEFCIERCIKALQSQDIDNHEIEIIVVNDGSTDDTSGVAGKAGIKVIDQAQGGPAKARNKGAQNAKGHILCFTDADCVPAENWLRKLTKPFEDETIAGSMGRYRTEQKSLTARFAQAEFEERYARYEKLSSIDLVATYSAAFRKNLFLEENGFNTNFPKADNEDVEFSYRLSRKGYKLVFAPDAIVFHTHPSGICKYMKQKFSRAIWRVLVYSLHPEKAVKDSYTPLTLKAQIALVIFIILWGLCYSFFHLSFAFLAGLLLLFTLTCVPFVIRIWTYDRIIALISPLFLFLRSVSFTFGIQVGLLKLVKVFNRVRLFK